MLRFKKRNGRLAGRLRADVVVAEFRVEGSGIAAHEAGEEEDHAGEDGEDDDEEEHDGPSGGVSTTSGHVGLTG